MEEIEELIEKAEKGYTATILKIEKTTSDEFFGSSKYDNREGYKITFKLESDELESDELESDKLEWNEFYNIPKLVGVTESKVYLFKQAYGELPKEGMKVVAVVKDGFFKVKF